MIEFKDECTPDKDNQYHSPNELLECSGNRLGLFPQAEKSFHEALNFFKKAEGYVKLAERIDRTLAFPSINELRYCSFHLFKALNQQKSTEQQEEFKRAIRHCQRASYDAIEICMVALLEQIKRFQDDYHGRLDFSAQLPEYPHLAGQVKSFQRDLKTIHDEDKMARYDELAKRVSIPRQSRGL